MRLIKMFGLAAMAAAIVMALVGVTSASAVTQLEEVVLCKTSGAGACPVAERFGSGTVIHGVSTSAPVLLGAFNILCAESKTLGTTTSALAHGEITALSFTTCHREGSAHTCTATAERLNYLIKGELNSTDTGYLALVTAKAGQERPEVLVKCPEDGIECKYGETTVTFEAEGTTDQVLKVLQSLTGLGFCFTSATWHAKYLTLCLEGTSEVACFLRME